MLDLGNLGMAPVYIVTVILVWAELGMETIAGQQSERHWYQKAPRFAARGAVLFCLIWIAADTMQLL
jgi:hypothetical protein